MSDPEAHAPDPTPSAASMPTELLRWGHRKMLEIRRSFDETELGFPKFSRFLHAEGGQVGAVPELMDFDRLEQATRLLVATLATAAELA